MKSVSLLVLFLVLLPSLTQAQSGSGEWTSLCVQKIEGKDTYELTNEFLAMRNAIMEEAVCRIDFSACQKLFKESLAKVESANKRSKARDIQHSVESGKQMLHASDDMIENLADLSDSDVDVVDDVTNPAAVDEEGVVRTFGVGVLTWFEGAADGTRTKWAAVGKLTDHSASLLETSAGKVKQKIVSSSIASSASSKMASFINQVNYRSWLTNQNNMIKPLFNSTFKQAGSAVAGLAFGVTGVGALLKAMVSFGATELIDSALQQGTPLRLGKCNKSSTGRGRVAGTVTSLDSDEHLVVDRIQYYDADNNPVFSDCFLADYLTEKLYLYFVRKSNSDEYMAEDLKNYPNLCNQIRSLYSRYFEERSTPIKIHSCSDKRMHVSLKGSANSPIRKHLGDSFSVYGDYSDPENISIREIGFFDHALGDGPHKFLIKTKYQSDVISMRFPNSEKSGSEYDVCMFGGTLFHQCQKLWKYNLDEKRRLEMEKKCLDRKQTVCAGSSKESEVQAEAANPSSTNNRSIQAADAIDLVRMFHGKFYEMSRCCAESKGKRTVFFDAACTQYFDSSQESDSNTLNGETGI